MLVDVVMPKLGESITEGTILKWWKKEGDTVQKDETLLEVSTDKVDVEIPSPATGIVKEILVQENETVEVGTVIARLEVEGEAPEPEEEKAPEKKEEPPKKEEPKAVKAPPKPEKKGKVAGQRFYSPLVLSIAQKEGITMEELANLPGSGRGGRVTKQDILAFVAKKKQKMGVPEVAPIPREGEGERVIPMDHIRKRIAQHMRESLDNAAHVYTVSEGDMTRIGEIIKKEKAMFLEREGFKLTYTPFIIYASVKALQAFPRVNARIEGDDIIYPDGIHLGLAVATERGLIVPVIRHAEQKSFLGLAREAYELAMKTRHNKLSPDDVGGSTFSITNYGIFGNIFGLPIINYPNTAILGVGAVKKRPVVIEKEEGDMIAIRSMVLLSLSFDHRLIDGDVAGKFLEQVVYYLENFDYAQA